jgi:hypothetical protein
MTTTERVIKTAQNLKMSNMEAPETTMNINCQAYFKIDNQIFQPDNYQSWQTATMTQADAFVVASSPSQSTDKHISHVPYMACH